MDKEKQKQIVIDDLDIISTKIGEQTRYVCFGVIAICFAIISVHYKADSRLYQIPIEIIISSSMFSIVALVFDYLHCLMGYFSSKQALNNDDNMHLYNEEWISYKLRSFFFVFKQIFMIASTIILLFGISKIF